MDTKPKQTIDFYKIRLIHVDNERYGFDDIDLQLIDLETNTAIAVFIGPEEFQSEYYFIREDFKFF